MERIDEKKYILSPFFGDENGMFINFSFARE